MKGAVFINYRSEDSHSYAALLHHVLTGHFGEDLVFLDCESIPAGADFVEELLGHVRSARVVLAVIGQRWLTATDPTTGQRRIDDPADWIRRELATAFAARVRVIPVLTDQAEGPREADLPADIVELSRCQYRRLRRKETRSDLARIVADLTSLDPVLAAADTSGPNDPAADEHWSRSASGVMPGEAGQRFRGREAALQEIISWLDRPQPPRPDCKVLVVTGSPGAGKSAVLGRIVLTASVAHDNPDDPGRSGEDGPRARAGSVDCAVHATGKTALDVAREIARAASAPIPEQPEDLPKMLRTVLEARPWRRFNLIIDALDEASDPAQARAIVRHVLVPIAENCADVGAQVIVGTRQFDGQGNLLDRFPSRSTLIDLDKPNYFELADLSAYAQATLQRSGMEQPANPYHDDAIAGPVAERIAELADKNFLIAGLVAHNHAVHDTHAISADEIQFAPRVGHLLTDLLDHVPSVEGIAAARVLRALAYIQAPGVPLELWQTALRAITGQTVQDDALWEFAQASAAANFLIETTDATTATGSVFRLFHQALNDALLNRALPGGEAKVTTAFISYGRELGWGKAPAYLLRSLPDHAARADRAAYTGLIDDLLRDVEYTLHADLRRLIPAARRAVSQDARDRARLLGHTPEATIADPSERAAMFSVTEVLDGLGTDYRDSPQPEVPYRAQWAHAEPSYENLTLRSPGSEVIAVCAVQVGDRTLLAAAGDDEDRTVRLWDPVDGSLVRVLRGHRDAVGAVCVVQVGDRTLLATAGDYEDRTVRLWDPVDGSLLRVLKGHWAEVATMCAVQVGDRTLLAAGSRTKTWLWDPADGRLVQILNIEDHARAVCAVQTDDSTLLAVAGIDKMWLWNPLDGSLVRVLKVMKDRHRGVDAMCVLSVDDRALLVVASGDGMVRLWDPVDGSLVRVLKGHHDRVGAVCVVQVGDRTLLATGSNDQTVRVWDPADGSQIHVLRGHTSWVGAMCAVQVGDRTLLATGSRDQTVRVWDLRSSLLKTDRQASHDPQGIVGAVCAVPTGDRALLASTSHHDDRAVRLWDPVGGSLVRVLKGHRAAVRTVCAVPAGDRVLLAAGGDDGTVWLWDPADWSQVGSLESHRGGIAELCAMPAGDRTLLAVAGDGDDPRVLLWDLVDRSLVHVLEGQDDLSSPVCAVQVGDWTLLATGSNDETVQLWDPADRSQIHVLRGHTSWVGAMCAVQVGDRTLLATGSHDQTVRVWDPADGSQIHVLRGHTSWVGAMCAVQVGDRTLLATGSNDQTVQLWDPANGRHVLTVPTHHPVWAATPVSGSLAVGLSAGVLVIKF